MSGVSLAVAPRNEPDAAASHRQKPADSQPRERRAAAVGIMGSLRVIELQLVAFIMVFSVSGLVSLLDLIFPAFASAYILLLSRFAFPSCGTNAKPERIFHGSRLFHMYIMLGTTLGLFLPLAYVLGGFARGDEHAVRSGTPHLFLLSFQILTENVICGLSLFSPPVRAFVPLLYTVRRIFVIFDWVQDVWIHQTLPANTQVKDAAWYWFGKSLAAANLAYFSVNLFGFLIPLFLPRAFEMYLREGDEVRAKRAWDKHSAAMRDDRKPGEKSD